MENIGCRLIIAALVLFAGVALNKLSKFLKMPILICFLGVGIVCGQYGLDIFSHWDMKTVQSLGEIALCFIIFTGGLQTSFKSIKSVFLTGTILATVGVVLTALIVGVAGLFFAAKISMFFTPTLSMAILGGAVISSTDAAAVFAILRGQKASINPRLQSLLEYESGSNDPAAFLLTSVMIGIVCSNASPDFLGIGWTITEGIVWGLGMGAAAGFLIGIFAQWFYNWIQTFLEYNGLRLVVAIAVVFFCYGIAVSVVHANSLMTCYVAGITMGNMRFNFKNIFIKFHEGISWLMQLMLFTVLGSYFDYHMLFNFRNMLAAIIISIILMFVARPLVVMLCMIKSPFSWKERLFTSWVGIRGSAPIMLAAMVLAAVPPDVMPTKNFFYIVFTVVLLSILVQGSSLMWVAKKLGLMMPYEEKDESLLEYDERSDGREINQFTVAQDSELVGKKLGGISVEESIVLLMIQRGGKIIQPKPDVVLQKGDSLSVLGERKDMVLLHDLYFSSEDYSSPLTFRQIWDEFSRKRAKRFARKRKSK